MLQKMLNWRYLREIEFYRVFFSPFDCRFYYVRDLLVPFKEMNMQICRALEHILFEKTEVLSHLN